MTAVFTTTDKLHLLILWDDAIPTAVPDPGQFTANPGVDNDTGAAGADFIDNTFVLELAENLPPSVLTLLLADAIAVTFADDITANAPQEIAITVPHANSPIVTIAGPDSLTFTFDAPVDASAMSAEDFMLVTGITPAPAGDISNAAENVITAQQNEWNTALANGWEIDLGNLIFYFDNPYDGGSTGPLT